MTDKLANTPFPGQKKGTIHVLIKQHDEQQEDTVQLRFNLFEDDTELADK